MPANKTSACLRARLVARARRAHRLSAIIRRQHVAFAGQASKLQVVVCRLKIAKAKIANQDACIYYLARLMKKAKDRAMAAEEEIKKLKGDVQRLGDEADWKDVPEAVRENIDESEEIEEDDESEESEEIDESETE